MKKKWLAIHLTACLLAVIFVFSAGTASALLKVNVMPSGVTSKVNAWDSRPYTWPGNPLELWGNVEYDGMGSLTYSWNFGAGEGSAGGAVTDMRNVAETHTYSGTGSFIATLTVTDGTQTDTDTVRIDVVPQVFSSELNLARQRALKYLYMNRSTRTVNNGCSAFYWTGGYGGREGAYTALAATAFQDYGHSEWNNKDNDIYAELVEQAMNYILYYIGTQGATNSPNTDSDINGNGRKLYPTRTHTGYEDGIIPMSLAHSQGDPTQTVRNCAAVAIQGDTYETVVEDLVDHIAYAQRDTGGTRGGWRYSDNSGPDNSVSQWPALGLAAAEGAPWNISAPAWVKTLMPTWINYSQSTVSRYCGTAGVNIYSVGGFGYTSSTSWNNIAKTGAGIIQMEYAGAGGNLTNAINFISNCWNTTRSDYGNLGDHYAMYAVKKGLQYAGITTVGGLDWQDEYNQWYVSNRVNNGTDGYYWNGSIRIQGGRVATIFAALVMAPGLVELPPGANAGNDIYVNPGVDVNFDCSGSSHADPTKNIVAYAWDLDGDGTDDALGALVTKAGGYPDTGSDYDVTVRCTVTDDNVPPLTDSDTLIVHVQTGNVPPHADPGGPYLGAVGEDLQLDGLSSYDDNELGKPNEICPGGMMTTSGCDEIVMWEWDIDGDGQYDDAVGPQPVVNFGAFIGTKTIGLRVTDSFGATTSQSTQATTVALSDIYLVNYDLISKRYNRRTRVWTVTWKVNMINEGTGPACDISAALTGNSIPAGVTVIDGNVAWDSACNSGAPNPLNSGETRLSADTFSYSYPRTVAGPDLSQITWDIEFTDEDLVTRHVVRAVPQ